MNTSHVGGARSREWLLVAASWMAVQLCGCDVEASHEAATGAVARVNDEIVLARELGDQVAKAGLHAGEGAGIRRKQVLEALVDERLLAQRALENRLDRQPETIAALEGARRRVLARAAIEQASGRGPIGEREIRDFYVAHPELFERRRTYVFHRFDLAAGKKLPPSLQKLLDKASSAPEVRAALRQANVAFTDRSETRIAQTLPAAMLKQATRMRKGDILILNDGAATVLMQLEDSVPDPMDAARAAPEIRAYLADERSRVAADALLRQLRKNARIEYYPGGADDVQTQADASHAIALPPGTRGREASIARVSAAASSR
ncbi:MAG TPA: EpsD family peptidyl-prolyl cis-trans isomerase [Burkholderiales bacterium]|nr:EpsD family peptidyl-prolyl cis-trans isomerase [Burkholderiales bacterium]